MAKTWKDIKINESFVAGDLHGVKVNDLEYIDVANAILGNQPMTPLVEAQLGYTKEDLAGCDFVTDPQTRVQRRVPGTAAVKTAAVPSTPTARIIPADSGVPVSGKKAPAPAKKAVPVSKAAAINEVKKQLAAEKAILRMTQSNVLKLERQLVRLQTKK